MSEYLFQSKQPTDVSTDEMWQAQRHAAELARLNARIARLAMTADVPLDTAEDLQKVLDHASTVLNSFSSNKRQRHELEELRGLLVIRCKQMAHMLDELGWDMTFEISKDIEKWLEGQGFRSGADGFALLRTMQDQLGAIDPKHTP